MNCVDLIKSQLEEECCVCLTKYNKENTLILFNCGHIGHYNCFLKLKNCPLCRNIQYDIIKYISSNNHNYTDILTSIIYDMNESYKKHSFMVIMSFIIFIVDKLFSNVLNIKYYLFIPVIHKFYMNLYEFGLFLEKMDITINSILNNELNIILFIYSDIFFHMLIIFLLFIF